MFGLVSKSIENCKEGKDLIKKERLINMDFNIIAEYFDKIERTSGRLEMTSYLTNLFWKTPKEEFDLLVYLCQGTLGPSYKAIEIGIGEKFVIEAIAQASGYSKSKIEEEYKKKGDLGLVAEKVMEKRKQSSLFSEKLTLKKVYGNFLKISEVEGKGSQPRKIKLLAELLNSAKPKEAKYIARMPLGKLRLGIGDPTIIDACAGMFRKGKELEDSEKERKEQVKIKEMIEKKYNVYSDLGVVLKTAVKEGLKGLNKIKMKPGVPIRPALGERLPNAEEIIKKLGYCIAEAKYDGFRMQVHKKGGEVIIFSRNEEEITDMFPEIVENVKKYIKGKNVIFEGEALAYDEISKEFYPFQITIQRKRKYGIAQKSKELPLKLFVFDVMFLEKDISSLKLKERRKILEKMIKPNKEIMPTEAIYTDNAKELEMFFEDCISRGLEGIMAKDLEAPYTAGARKFAWIKLKRSYKGSLEDTIDVCIVGYFKGKGQRAKFGLGALLTAVYDDKEDCFKTVARIGSGMTEENMEELHKLLSKIERKNKDKRVVSEIEPDKWVDLKYVVEVVADEITKSPVHTAAKEKGEGLALRFPRMIKIRFDKNPEDATSVKELIEMYKKQKRVGLE